jgi:hypothetical protein
VSKKRNTKKVKSAKSKPSKPTSTKKPSVIKKKQTSTPSLAKLSASLFSSLNVTAAAAATTRAVAFVKDNANVVVQVTTAGQNDIVPCTLSLPVGIFPLHYQAQGVGTFNVTVTAAELSHPIAGAAPDSGAILIKVS